LAKSRSPDKRSNSRPRAKSEQCGDDAQEHHTNRHKLASGPNHATFL
jgi:hypothetical protein